MLDILNVRRSCVNFVAACRQILLVPAIHISDAAVFHILGHACGKLSIRSSLQAGMANKWHMIVLDLHLDFHMEDAPVEEK